MTRASPTDEPSELEQIQAFFAAQLRKRRALSKDPALAERARAIVSTTGQLSAIERLEIYREQFWLRHTASLIEDFPGLSGILGQTAWEALIEAYLEAHPPTSFTLRDLGLCLPQYVANQRQLPQHALCSDMARLELAYLEIFDAAEPAPLNAGALTGIPEAAWQRARIALHPALRVLAFEYPVATLRTQLFHARTSGEIVPLPARQPQHVLLFRRNLSMFHEPISAGAYALLSALTRRVPLVPACEQAQAEAPEEAQSIAENVGAWFQSWAARGFIASVEV